MNEVKLTTALGFLHYLEVGALLDVIQNMSSVLDSHTENPDAQIANAVGAEVLESMMLTRNALVRQLSLAMLHDGAINEADYNRFHDGNLGARELLKAYWTWAIDKNDPGELTGQLPGTVVN